VIEPSSIGFVTLLLGLTSGSWQVEVMVAPPAVAAEILLDGAAVATLRGVPWKATVDFGRELVPHELTAAALDSEGRVVGHATQWVNMPQPEARVDVVLERDAQGNVVAARVGWASKQGLQRTGLKAELDGAAIEPSGPDLLPLPGVDMSRAHVLRVKVLFAPARSATREVVFGGSVVGAEARAALTAGPALVKNEHDTVTVGELQGLVRVAGQPAPVVAVERSPFTVAMVVEEGAFAALQKLGARWLDELWFHGHGGMFLQGPDRLLLVDPRPTAAQGVSSGMTEVFPTRVFASFNCITLPGFLASIAPSSTSTTQPRLGDAVAVAGVLAAGGQGRRAVLLVVNSKVAPAELKRACTLLSALGVPLHVWSMGPKPPSASSRDCGVWSKVGHTDMSRLRKANEALQEELSRQVLLWVDGTHRPQDVTLAPGGPLEGLVR
jgi:hypothetical protein